MVNLRLLLQQRRGHHHLHAALAVKVVGFEDDSGFADGNENRRVPFVLAHDGLMDVRAENRCSADGAYIRSQVERERAPSVMDVTDIDAYSDVLILILCVHGSLSFASVEKEPIGTGILELARMLFS